jgi:hypothetical protein
MKPLSEQLANLSVRAKNTEDAAAAAQKEAHDKVVARVAQAQATAEQAVKKVDQNIKSASDTASAKWNGMKAKIAADMDDLKSKVAQRKHDLSVKRAANYASCWTKTPLSPSTMPSHLSSRLRWPCSMLSLATSRSKKPSAQPPDPNIRLGFGETAARRSLFLHGSCCSVSPVWPEANIPPLLCRVRFQGIASCPLIGLATRL